MTPRQKQRFENLITDCLNAGFVCGDWSNVPGDESYETVHKQARVIQAKLLVAIDRAIRKAQRGAR